MLRPAWYAGIESVQVFTPQDAVGSAAWDLYQKMQTAQFSDQRHALLLTRGNYDQAEIAVGYYTSVIGVGDEPDDVTVASFYTLDNPDVGNACDNVRRPVSIPRSLGCLALPASVLHAPLAHLVARSRLASAVLAIRRGHAHDKSEHHVGSLAGRASAPGAHPE